jgi:molybdopterin converting factor small subunit
MQVTIQFFSYLKELTGCTQTTETVAAGTTLGALHDQAMVKFPKLAPMKKSTRLAVGVDYQSREYHLQDGAGVSLFPPVQSG